MNFLTPIPMLVAAGLAVPALLALYFLKLRRRPVRVSSTMLWEDAASDLEVNTPWRWIRSSWLLWLHLLILAMLLLALGRPTVDARGERPERVILVVDRSASMNAMGADGRSRLDLALERAEQIVEEATGRGTEVAVLAMDTTPVLMGPASTSTGELRRMLGGIRPSDRPGRPQLAFDLAQTLALGGEGESGDQTPSTVIFLSDGGDTLGQAFSLAGASFGYELIAGDAALDNLGVVSLSARRDLVDPAVVRLFFRLINTGAAEVAAPISVEAGGSEGSGAGGVAESLRRFAVVVPGAAAGVPGEYSRTIEIRLDRAETITLRVERADALAADNAAGLRVPRPESPALLLVSAPDGEGAPDPSPLLRDVLTALEPRVLRSVSLATYELNARSPGDADLIVFDGVSPSLPPVKASLSFGSAPLYLSPDPEAMIEAAGLALSWDRAHPVLRDVSLDSLIVSRAMVLPTRAPAAVERVDVLVSGERSPLIVEYGSGGVEHVVVAFSPRDSNWPLQVSFAIFMAQALEHLAPIGAGAPGQTYTTGEPVRVRAESGAGTVRLEGPETLTARVIGGVANLGVPRLTGLYRGSDASGTETPVSLLDAAESSLRTAERVEIAGRSVSASAEPELGPTEIWRWLVLVALGLLAVDWVLYGMQMRIRRTREVLPGSIGMGEQA